MRWIYILGCSNDIIYVGETKNIKKRLNDHIKGKGAYNTQQNKPEELMGLYKVNNNINILNYMKEIKKKDFSLNEKIKEKLKELLKNMEYYVETKEDALKIENYITERIIIGCSEYDYSKIRGGKYTKKDQYIVKPTEYLTEEYTELLKSRPYCNCGIPCEIRKWVNGNKIKLYYICSLKNIWDDLIHGLNIIKRKPCNYYEEYLDDIYYRIEIMK
jgi:putative endonuclease